MHFLLWTKWSHESTNFDTFKCSGENLPNYLCHFPNHKPVFLQILHDSLVPLKRTPLYFFWSNVICFAEKGQITVQILETWVLRNSPNSCHFWNNKSFFLQILHHSSQSWDITPLYFLAEILYIFNERSLSKYKFGEQLKVWNFGLWWAPVVKII